MGCTCPGFYLGDLERSRPHRKWNHGLMEMPQEVFNRCCFYWFSATCRSKTPSYSEQKHLEEHILHAAEAIECNFDLVDLDAFGLASTWFIFFRGMLRWRAQCKLMQRCEVYKLHKSDQIGTKKQSCPRRISCTPNEFGPFASSNSLDHITWSGNWADKAAKQVAMQLSPHPNLPHCNPMGRQPQLVVYFLLPSVEQLQVIACSHNPSRLSSDVVYNASVPHQIRHSRSSRLRLESLESPYWLRRPNFSTAMDSGERKPWASCWKGPKQSRTLPACHDVPCVLCKSCILRI